MAKKGYASQAEAQRVADERNLMSANSLYGLLPHYAPYHYHDPVTGERKWFVRQEPKSPK